MGKGRFVNQKLGKRTSRRMSLLQSRFRAGRPGEALNPAGSRFPKKGFSREGRGPGPS